MKKQHNEEVETVVGVAWYSEQDWTRLRLICSDPEEMDDSYAEWRAAAEKTIGDLAKLGRSAEKVDIDIDEFLRWCRLHGRKTDKASRAEFTAYCLRARRSGS
jgi:hypothetical protein